MQESELRSTKQSPMPLDQSQVDDLRSGSKEAFEYLREALLKQDPLTISDETRDADFVGTPAELSQEDINLVRHGDKAILSKLREHSLSNLSEDLPSKNDISPPALTLEQINLLRTGEAPEDLHHYIREHSEKFLLNHEDETLKGASKPAIPLID